MRKFRWLILSLLALLLVLVPAVPGHAQALSKKYVQSTTPTIFFHGFGSSAHAEQYMVDNIMKAGVSKTAIVANVAADGQVTLQGRIPKGAINPLV